MAFLENMNNMTDKATFPRIQNVYRIKAGRNLDPDGNITLYIRARVKFFDDIKTYKSKS